MTIYEKRQDSKKLNAAYREAARNIKLVDPEITLSVSDHCSISPMAEGCFVEVTVWIPLHKVPHEGS